MLRSLDGKVVIMRVLRCGFDFFEKKCKIDVT